MLRREVQEGPELTVSEPYRRSTGRRVSRRPVLCLALVTAALVGCGGGDDSAQLSPNQTPLPRTTIAPVKTPAPPPGEAKADRHHRRVVKAALDRHGVDDVAGVRVNGVSVTVQLKLPATAANRNAYRRACATLVGHGAWLQEISVTAPDNIAHALLDRGESHCTVIGL